MSINKVVIVFSQCVFHRVNMAGLTGRKYKRLLLFIVKLDKKSSYFPEEKAPQTILQCLPAVCMVQ